MIPLSVLLLAGYVLVFNGLLFKLGLEDKKYLGIHQSRAIKFGIFLLAYGLPLILFFPQFFVTSSIGLLVSIILTSIIPIQKIDRQIIIFSSVCLTPIALIASALFSINVVINFRGKKFPVIYNYSIFFILSSIIWGIIYWLYFL